MTDDRLQDARRDARDAVAGYNALSRDQRMDQDVLTRHALRFREALDGLVQATRSRYDGALPDPLQARSEAAGEALSEFDDPNSYQAPQQVRRACYVLRKETTSLLDALDGGD